MDLVGSYLGALITIQFSSRKELSMW